jgi:DNA polymerase-3 subunit beta
VDEPGETLAVADTLSRIVSECPDEVLSIETAENLLHVRGEGSHFQIVTQEPTEFPSVPEMGGEPDFTVERGVLSRLIEWTAFAAARESTRYAINGVLWEASGERLTLAATDGRRLSMARGALAGVAKSEGMRAIVPGKALSLFGRLAGDPATVVGVKGTTNQVLLDVGPAFISTSLVEGNFPKYEDVVPDDCDRVMEVSTSELLGALRRAALLTNEESKGVRVSLSEGNLTLSSRAPEEGEATVSLPVRYSGEPMEIGFNPVFLTDPLRVAHAEEIKIAFKESNRPGVISIGGDFIYVVMPVNLASA